MEEGIFKGAGWKKERIRVIKEGDKKTVFLNGRLYMSWQINDEASQRIAIVQIYVMGNVVQEEIAKAFGIHVNSVYNYIQSFETEGSYGLINQKRSFSAFLTELF